METCVLDGIRDLSDVGLAKPASAALRAHLETFYPQVVISFTKTFSVDPSITSPALKKTVVMPLLPPLNYTSIVALI